MRTTIFILLVLAILCFFSKSVMAQQNPGAISVNQSGNTVTITTVVNPYSTNFLKPLAKVRVAYFKAGYGWKSAIVGYLPAMGGNLTFQRPTDANGLDLLVRKEVSWQLQSGTKWLCTNWQQ